MRLGLERLRPEGRLRSARAQFEGSTRGTGSTPKLKGFVVFALSDI
jgi:hypothetical protein